MSGWSVRMAADRPAPMGAAEFVIEESLGYVVNRTARHFAHLLAERLRPHGVGIGQWAVLMFLWARDGISQAELSRLVAIEPPTMVRTIDRMVRDGLVTRAPDPQDGRASRIHLTDRGRSIARPARSGGGRRQSIGGRAVDRGRGEDAAEPPAEADRGRRGDRSAERTVERHLVQGAFEDRQLLIGQRLTEELGDRAQVRGTVSARRPRPFAVIDTTTPRASASALSRATRPS